MKPLLKFSWRGLLLAPFFVPFFYSAAVASVAGGCLWFSFLFFFIGGSIFSYGTTIFLFLPSLYLLSKLMRPTSGATAVLGAVLGGAAYLPLGWMMYQTSGIDSGPPQGTFIASLWRDLFDPAVWAFPFGGMMTAAIYWLFARHEAKQDEEPQAPCVPPSSPSPVSGLATNR
jgi:hypothetical protein